MDYFPLFHRIKNKVCLIVGGGDIAFRKASLLRRAGARLVIISPEFCTPFEAWRTAIDILFITQNYRESVDENLLNARYFDHQPVELVISATDDIEVNQAVAKACGELNKLVNVVDNPILSTVILPAIIDRSPVLIAVSSEGQSPVLARHIRSKLETLIPTGFGALGRFMGAYRNTVKERLPAVSDRRIFWEEVIASPISECIFTGREEEAKALIAQKLDDWCAQNRSTQIGEVYLVGAGPGDPDLLTFRALRLMQQADVVLYDRLVSEPIMDLVRRDATKIYVGKSRKEHAVPQDQINQLLIKLALEGKRVCRLKGGDPFIFGRGGEELEELTEHRIPFQVVPGITAASGCACYAGIPLTHRDYAQAVIFVTAHTKEGKIDINWSECAKGNQTVVYYMGLNNLKEITDRLMAHGMSHDMPIALIERGTTPFHRVLTGVIGDFFEQIQPIYASIHAPTLIIVGEVVKLHSKLAWYKPQQEGL